jgi:sRNA-binding protein
MFLYLTFFSLVHAADALAMTNARIASLEAELKASQKAWDAATAAKASAEKSAKAAMTKAKKDEKALADANQGRIQREEAITDRLNRISALAGGECLFLLPACLSCWWSLVNLFVYACRENWGILGAVAAS